MTQKSDNPAPHAGEKEPVRVQDGQDVPSDGSPNSGKGIPPLPEPNVEGVGEESGPSAGKTDLKGETLSPDDEKKVKDATGLEQLARTGAHGGAMPMQRVNDKAVVFLPWETIEREAQQQILNTAKMPFVFKHVAVMPDCHYGKGATVGTVLATEGAIIPAAVGVDIGCGMIAVRTPLTRPTFRTPAAVRAGIERRIPMSAGKNNARLTARPPPTRVKTLEALAERDARHARPVRQELAAGARHARRRQSLHRAGRGRRRRGLADAALRLARRRQQDRQPLHQGRAGPVQEDAGRAARSRPGLSARRPSRLRRVPARSELGAAVRAPQPQRDDGPRAGGGERAPCTARTGTSRARAAAHQLASQLHAAGASLRPPRLGHAQGRDPGQARTTGR